MFTFLFRFIQRKRETERDVIGEKTRDKYTGGRWGWLDGDGSYAIQHLLQCSFEIKLSICPSTKGSNKEDVYKYIALFVIYRYHFFQNSSFINR